MKYSFEARAEAHKNRQNIIDTKVGCAIEELKACIDRTIEKGHCEFSVDLSKFLGDFDTEIKEKITNYLSMYDYYVEWVGRYIVVVSFEGD